MSVSDNVWRDLLAASVEMQTASGSTEAHQPPSKENMEYLQNAMAATFGTVPAEKSVMQRFLEIGKKDDLTYDENDESVEIAEQLVELLCSGNFPVVFTQKEGLDCLLQLAVTSFDEEVRFSYLSLIPLIAENNLDFQNAVVEHPLFESLLNKSLNASTARIVGSTLSAISSIVRSCPKAWQRFHSLKGLEKFEKVVESYKQQRVAAKAALILTNIKFTLVECADEKEIKSSQVDQKYMDLCDVIFRSYIHLKTRKSSEEFVVETLNTVQQKMIELPVELYARISEDVKQKLAEFVKEIDPKLKEKFHVAINKKFHLLK